jgi:hypothetical protein
LVAFVECGMLMRRPDGAGPGSGGQDQGSAGRGQGFFDAPWWRLLLWAVIFVAALVLAEELGILG